MNSLSTQALVKAGILAIALSACATLDGRPPEEVVKERAQSRWDLLIKGDVEAAYKYLSPGSRTLTSLESYLKMVPKGFWKSVVVQNATCTADSCDVGGVMEYDFQGHRIKTPYKEKWIREGSNWWFFAG